MALVVEMKKVQKFKKKTSRFSKEEIKPVEDFSENIQETYSDSDVDSSDIDRYLEEDDDYHQTSGTSMPFIDQSLFNDQEISDDEDVGKREFVSASISDQSNESEDDIAVPKKQSLPPVSLSEIETLRLNLLNSPFDKKVVIKICETCNYFLESSSQNSVSILEANGNDDAFSSIVKLILIDLLSVFEKELDFAEDSDFSLHPTWENCSKLIRRAIDSLIKLIKTVFEPTSLLMVFSGITQWLKFLPHFPPLLAHSSNAIMDIWSGVLCNGHEDERVKVASILLLRKLCLLSDTTLSLILKGMYLRFSESAKSITTHNISIINFMLNSMMEMYRLNPTLSYHHAFLFIRQLALLVRSLYSTGIATEARAKQVKRVFSWQFLYCLKFWSRLVSIPNNIVTDPSSDSAKLHDMMGQLVYPVVQICVCVLNVNQKTKQQYFPFFLQIIHMLNEIALGRNINICTFNYAFSILDCMNSNRSLAKTETLKPVDLTITFKVTKAFVNTRLYFDMLVEECTNAILQNLAVPCLACSFGFVEIGEIIRLSATKLVKSSRNPKVLQFMNDIIEVIKENQQFVLEERKMRKELLKEKCPLIKYWNNHQKTIEQKKRMEYEALKKQ